MTPMSVPKARMSFCAAPSFIADAARVGQTGRFAWFSRKTASKESRQSGQFALPSRRAFHCFRASQRDMKAPQKIDRIYHDRKKARMISLPDGGGLYRRVKKSICSFTGPLDSRYQSNGPRKLTALILLGHSRPITLNLSARIITDQFRQQASIALLHFAVEDVDLV